MISIETQYLPTTVGKAGHVRARSFGISAVYVTARENLREHHLKAATEVAKIAIPCEPQDLVVKLVHSAPIQGFAVWIAFDRRKG